MRRTVMIVDDHEQFRRSARKLLELEGFDVVGEASDGATGVAAVDRLRPDLVLVDVGLPDMTGFEVSERIGDATRVVLVSSRQPADIGLRARRCRARGFVPKDELTGESLAAFFEDTA